MGAQQDRFQGAREPPRCAGTQGTAAHAAHPLKFFHGFLKKGLLFLEKRAIIYERSRERHAPVAQLDRVFGYEPKGRGFESLLAYQQHEHILFRFGSIVFVFLYFPRRSTRPKPRRARAAV